jgi:hypothetical protein
MVVGVPSGDAGETFPVVVTTIGVGMVPNGAAGVIAVGDIDKGGAAIEGDGSAGNVAGCGDDRDVTVTA